MSGSVEGAKDAVTQTAKDAGQAACQAAGGDLGKGAGESPRKEPGGEKTVSAALPTKEAASPPRKAWLRLDARTMAAATGALVVGVAFGMVTAPRERSGDALTRIESGLEAGRGEASRLNAEVERLTRALAAIRESSEAAHGEGKTLATAVTDRLARLEEGLDRKIAALAEKVEPAPRVQSAALPGPSSPAEKHAAAAPGTTPAPVAALLAAPLAPPAAAKAEPTQTASIAEARPKSETVESWALREVYDGVAMLEDRKRRLVEVAPGDTVPGLGRVESIEQRGRTWVVVTRQGLITPQMW